MVEFNLKGKLEKASTKTVLVLLEPVGLQYGFLPSSKSLNIVYKPHKVIFFVIYCKNVNLKRIVNRLYFIDFINVGRSITKCMCSEDRKWLCESSSCTVNQYTIRKKFIIISCSHRHLERIGRSQSPVTKQKTQVQFQHLSLWSCKTQTTCFVMLKIYVHSVTWRVFPDNIF